MKSSYYLDTLRGRSQELPAVRSKVVRVFVSSTFTGRVQRFSLSITRGKSNSDLDTLTERDSLIENIFPKLKDYCREKYGLEFQVSGFLCSTSTCFALLLRSTRTCDGAFRLNQRITTGKWRHVSKKSNCVKSTPWQRISWLVSLGETLLTQRSSDRSSRSCSAIAMVHDRSRRRSRPLCSNCSSPSFSTNRTKTTTMRC